MISLVTEGGGGGGPLRKTLLLIEPSIFLMEKLPFSLKLFLAIFMDNPSLRLSEVLLGRSHTI